MIETTYYIEWCVKHNSLHYTRERGTGGTIETRGHPALLICGCRTITSMPATWHIETTVFEGVQFF